MPNHPGQLDAFFASAATTGDTVPEISTLDQTISAWRTEIARGVLTGHSDSAAEDVNPADQLVYRGAFGFTNVIVPIVVEVVRARRSGGAHAAH